MESGAKCCEQTFPGLHAPNQIHAPWRPTGAIEQPSDLVSYSQRASAHSPTRVNLHTRSTSPRIMKGWALKSTNLITCGNVHHLTAQCNRTLGHKEVNT